MLLQMFFLRKIPKTKEIIIYFKYYPRQSWCTLLHHTGRTRKLKLTLITIFVKSLLYTFLAVSETEISVSSTVALTLNKHGTLSNSLYSYKKLKIFFHAYNTICFWNNKQHRNKQVNCIYNYVFICYMEYAISLISSMFLIK